MIVNILLSVCNFAMAVALASADNIYVAAFNMFACGFCAALALAIAINEGRIG